MFRKQSDKIKIERLDNEANELNGEKLTGETFDYEDGSGEANLYQMDEGGLAIEIRLTDTKIICMCS